MNHIDLQGKTAVITGGARGIGLAVARRLLASGARCSLWDNDAAALEAATKSLGQPDRVQTVTVNITDESRVAAATEATRARVSARPICS